MDNPQELKKSILKLLAEKGDYTTILKHLSAEEKEKKSGDSQEKLTKLITPISAFADILTENSKGAFLEDLTARLDETTAKGLKDLSDAITEARSTLQTELRDLMDSTKSEAINEHLARYQEAEQTLTDKMMALAVEVATAKADELFPRLASEAKLTEAEIEEIVDITALSVESQLDSIIGAYLAEQKLTASQITDFSQAVAKLLPPDRQVTWNDIVGKPDLSQGGTNTNVVRQLIADALATLPSASLPDQTGNAGKFLTTDGSDASWGVPSGSGAVDSVNGQTGVVVLDATDVSAIPSSEKGADNGVAELVGGKVPSAQLPSFVDDVIEVANFAALPVTGETGKIYITQDTNLTYRWSGSAYVEISASLALGETSSTAYRGDRGATAFAHVSLTDNPHSVTKTQVGLGNVDNTSDADKPVSTATQTALDAKVAGPASATDNALARYDGTTGKVVQTSLIKIDDAGQFINDSAANTSFDFVNNGQGSITFKNASNATAFRFDQEYFADGNGSYLLLSNGLNAAYVTAHSTVESNVSLYLDGKGTGKVISSKDLEVPDEAYGAGWDGSVEVPTKNAVYDEVQTKVTGPASAADNAVVRYDSTTGKVVQDSTVFITDTGNVGIGTPSPTQKLAVKTASTGVENYAVIGDSFDRLKIGYGQTTGIVDNVVSAQIIANATGDLVLSSRTNSASGIQFYTNAGTDGLERMRIDTAGNVGIGTPSPTEKLHVVGDAYITNDIELGHASDTTISRVSAGVVAVENQTLMGYILTSEASSATPTITGTALRNDYVATALAANATLAAPSGTANASAVLRYRITASGGTRTIGYNAGLLAGGITRTTSLATGETLTQVYERIGATWVCQFESVTS